MKAAQRETGIARARRLMREQKCHTCELPNPDISVRENGKTQHYHIVCR